MPMSVTYTNYNGRIVCENRGGVETLFMPDTLGNVIETRDMATGVKTSETTYWPYGEVRTQTGTNPSPWGFCGVWGYYSAPGEPMYVRARYDRPALGRWMTVDPLWHRTTYTYDLAGQQIGRQDARGNRITYTYDAAGRQIALRNELNLATTSCYNAAGLAVTVLDANGWVKTHTYDTAGQLTGTQYEGLLPSGDQFSPCAKMHITV